MILTAHPGSTMAQRLSGLLSEVECRFTAALVSDLPCVNQLVEHVERYRGKMLRPALVLTSGLAAAGASQATALDDSHYTVAAVMEMIHMATLVHDDVLDEAQVRRRGATVNQLNGNETAVMMGDYLVSRAYHLCSHLPRAELNQVVSQATNLVCEGELLQLANRNNWALDEATYFEIIRRKTASLCGTSCRLGAMIAQADPTICQRLHQYGEKLGTAFQIVDDLLDLIGDPQTVGKTLGRDLHKGKLTLPVIHHLRLADPQQRQQLVDLLDRHRQTESPDDGILSASDITRRMQSTDSITYAQESAGRLVREATELVQSLPPSDARNLLVDIAQAILTRKF